MVSLVASLAARGAVVGVATSKPRAFAVPLLERLGYAPSLSVVEGPSLDPALAEDKATTLRRALDAVGDAASDAVLVGDRHHDVDAAHANGIRCIGVLWGIGDATELAGADALAATPAELGGELGL
jgi:phosphoglycolate phosphatase